MKRRRGGSLAGARAVFRGMSLITKPRLRRFVIWPLLLNVVLFVLVGWLGLHFFQDTVNWAMDRTWSSANQVVQFVLWLLFAVLFLLVALNSFVVMSTLLGSPFYGWMTETLEKQLSGIGSEDSLSLGQISKDVIHSLKQEVHKLAYFVCWMIPLLILGFIPVVNVIAPFALLLFGIWSLALECMDFTLANHRIPFSTQRSMARRHWFLMVGYGGATLALTLIPIVNLFAIPAAAAGGVLLWREFVQPHE